LLALLTSFLSGAFSKSLTVIHFLFGSGIASGSGGQISKCCKPHRGRGYLHGVINDLALLWVLNMSDGSHALLDIAEQAGIGFADVTKAPDAFGREQFC
jgi:hypothetical protein